MCQQPKPQRQALYFCHRVWEQKVYSNKHLAFILKNKQKTIHLSFIFWKIPPSCRPTSQSLTLPSEMSCKTNHLTPDVGNSHRRRTQGTVVGLDALQILIEGRALHYSSFLLLQFWLQRTLSQSSDHTDHRSVHCKHHHSTQPMIHHHDCFLKLDRSCKHRTLSQL